MGTVTCLKKSKPVLRGPRGGVLIDVRQTWCRLHDGYTVTIRKLGEKDARGKQRVWFSKKGSKTSYWENLAEMSFRGNYMEQSEYAKFTRACIDKMQAYLDANNASPAAYSFFNIKCTPPAERGKLVVAKSEPEPAQPIPKKGEIWKGKRRGASLEILGRHNNDGELWIEIKSPECGVSWGSVSYLHAFKGNYIRIRAADGTLV